MEKIPIAAVSIARVHGGILKDGTRMVIKMQHLQIETMMRYGLRNLSWIVYGDNKKEP